MQHPERQAHHLQILAASRRADVPRLRPNVESHRFLKPGDEEVSSLVDDILFDTGETVEDDCASSALDIVDGGAGEGEGEGGGDGEPVDLVEYVGGHDLEA
jgi:hypothetical protein